MCFSISVRIFSFLLVAVLLTSACLSFGGMFSFSKISKIEVSHTHDHSADGHSHHEEQYPENQTPDTHTHTIIIAVQAAVVVPQVVSTILKPRAQENQFAIGEFLPPVDPCLASIFRPPIYV